MRILVISDTHGEIGRVPDVYNKLASEAPIDMIVHCGDFYADAQEIRARLGVPMLAVKGNCDGCFDSEGYAVLETEFGNILITHGHMDDVDFSMQKLYYRALDMDCAGAFFGHTHRSVFVETGGVYLLNPGSLTRPHDGTGGTFGLVVTSERELWGKIYRYEDFTCASQNGTSGSIQGVSRTKPKIKGGHLRDLINYSDRF